MERWPEGSPTRTVTNGLAGPPGAWKEEDWEIGHEEVLGRGRWEECKDTCVTCECSPGTAFSSPPELGG